jgi:hypothetical protein
VEELGELPPVIGRVEVGDVALDSAGQEVRVTAQRDPDGSGRHEGHRQREPLEPVRRPLLEERPVGPADVRDPVEGVEQRRREQGALQLLQRSRASPRAEHRASAVDPASVLGGEVAPARSSSRRVLAEDEPLDGLSALVQERDHDAQRPVLAGAMRALWDQRLAGDRGRLESGLARRGADEVLDLGLPEDAPERRRALDRDRGLGLRDRALEQVAGHHLPAALPHVACDGGAPREGVEEQARRLQPALQEQPLDLGQQARLLPEEPHGSGTLSGRRLAHASDTHLATASE